MGLFSEEIPGSTERRRAKGTTTTKSEKRMREITARVGLIARFILRYSYLGSTSSPIEGERVLRSC